jgi:hypothetical protein
MKKLLAFICTLAIVAAGAVTAFAADSPSGEVKYKVNFATYASGSKKVSTNYTVEGDTIKFTASESQYTFEKWEISGDYEIVSGSLTSKTLVIRPKADVSVVELFKEVSTSGGSSSNTSDKSPTTGDAFSVFAALIALISAGAFVVVKKNAKAF